METQRVLIVDDDANVARVIARVFRKASFEVSVANNGEEALSLLHEGAYDAMISDINMPRMDGRELCRQVWNSDVPTPRCVFIVTSRTEAEERDWIQDLPGVKLVEKPVPPRSLVRLVKDRLSESVGGEDWRTEKEAA